MGDTQIKLLREILQKHFDHGALKIRRRRRKSELTINLSFLICTTKPFRHQKDQPRSHMFYHPIQPRPSCQSSKKKKKKRQNKTKTKQNKTKNLKRIQSFDFPDLFKLRVEESVSSFFFFFDHNKKQKKCQRFLQPCLL